MSKREEAISKLEKDKREVALARDKAVKQIEDVDKVRIVINWILHHLAPKSDIYKYC